MVRPLISLEGIHLGATASNKTEAVALCGSALYELGAIQESYKSAMQERELIFSSYMGNGVAIPHGTDDSRKFVNFGQLVFVRFSKPVMWDDEEVLICVGIAAKEDEHNEILGNLADVLVDELQLNKLRVSEDKNEILQLLTSVSN
jgi:mannitol/fructose-specific phosphotransferase system IIA component